MSGFLRNPGDLAGKIKFHEGYDYKRLRAGGGRAVDVDFDVDVSISLLGSTPLVGVDRLVEKRY